MRESSCAVREVRRAWRDVVEDVAAGDETVEVDACGIGAENPPPPPPPELTPILVPPPPDEADWVVAVAVVLVAETFPATVLEVYESTRSMFAPTSVPSEAAS